MPFVFLFHAWTFVDKYLLPNIAGDEYHTAQCKAVLYIAECESAEDSNTRTETPACGKDPASGIHCRPDYAPIFSGLLYHTRPASLICKMRH